MIYFVMAAALVFVFIIEGIKHIFHIRRKNAMLRMAESLGLTYQTNEKIKFNQDYKDISLFNFVDLKTVEDYIQGIASGLDIKVFHYYERRVVKTGAVVRPILSVKYSELNFPQFKFYKRSRYYLPANIALLTGLNPLMLILANARSSRVAFL